MSHKHKSHHSHETTEATKETTTNEAGTPATPVEAVRAKVTSTLNDLIDRGSVYASAGLGYLKIAIENGARALERTAKTLETYQERFKKEEPKAAA